MPEGVIVQFVPAFCSLRGRVPLMRHLVGAPFLLAFLYPLSARLTLERALDLAEQANQVPRFTPNFVLSGGFDA